MNKIKNINHFTLIELLVSMGIFSILLVLSMNFFTSAQRMWVATEEKNEVHSDARMIMDLLSSKLQTLHYNSDTSFQLPLEIGRPTSNDKNYHNYIIFTSLSKEKFDKNDDETINLKLFAISEINQDGGLAFLVLTDKSKAGAS